MPSQIRREIIVSIKQFNSYSIYFVIIIIIIIKSFRYSIAQIEIVVPNTTHYTGMQRTSPAGILSKQYLQMAISLLIQIKYSQENHSVFFVFFFLNMPPLCPRKQHVRKASKQTKMTSRIRQTWAWITEISHISCVNWVTYSIFSVSIISLVTGLIIITL